MEKKKLNLENAHVQQMADWCWNCMMCSFPLPQSWQTAMIAAIGDLPD